MAAIMHMHNIMRTAQTTSMCAGIRFVRVAWHAHGISLRREYIFMLTNRNVAKRASSWLQPQCLAPCTGTGTMSCSVHVPILK